MFEKSDDNSLIYFYCPGCKCSHGINDSWKIDMKTDTVSPSILVRSANEKGPTVCHSFIKNGQIQYLKDCTHELAGKTVPMEAI